MLNPLTESIVHRIFSDGRSLMLTAANFVRRREQEYRESPILFKNCQAALAITLIAAAALLAKFRSGKKLVARTATAAATAAATVTAAAATATAAAAAITAAAKAAATAAAAATTAFFTRASFVNG